MKVVKISNEKKERLEQLNALLTLRLGKKILQQSLLDACIEVASTHLEELELKFLDSSESLTEERVQEILKFNIDFNQDTDQNLDNVIYGGE